MSNSDTQNVRRPKVGGKKGPKSDGSRSAASGKGNVPRTTQTKVTRRSQRSRWRRFVGRTSEIWTGLLEKPAIWVSVFVLVGLWALVPTRLLFAPNLAPGSIANRDYVASRDLLLLDEESTREKERRAREDVLPVYDFDASAVRDRVEALGRLFEEGRLLNGESTGDDDATEPTPAEARARLEQRSGLQVTEEEAQVLRNLEFSRDLEDRLASLVRQVLSQGVVANRELLLENRMRGVTRRNLETGEEIKDLDLYEYLGYPDELRELLESEIRDWSGLRAAQRSILVDFLAANLQPNLSLNQSETLSRRDVAAEAVDRAFNRVQKGQVIVRKGDRIGDIEARAIEQLYGRHTWQSLLLPALGSVFLLLLAATVLWLGLRREKVADHSPRRLFAESLLLLLISLLGAKFSVLMATALAKSFSNPLLSAETSYLWAVPWAALALMSALLAGRNVALYLSLLMSVLLVQLVAAAPLDLLIYCLAGSLAAIFSVEQFQLKQRLGLARIGLVVAAVNVLIILLLAALEGELVTGPARLSFDLLCGVVGGLLTAAVVSFALPILEAWFGITTEIKLIELANTNLPVLRRLAFEAPGTFQHSLMVANLAKEGCEAIGADATLAYTGGLYHDIGKVFRPEYFIENQRHGYNPHDKLQPSMSTLILINHVKDGVELAHRHHLPRSVVDAIEQHHGTRLITFFYKRAQEQSDPDTGEVREEKYRYPGPRPRNKVMAVLMLADGVEAASRTLTEPSPVKVRTLLRTIFDDCLQDGQLDHSDLTLSEVKKVSEAFFRVLTNIFHQRVDYPGFDFNVPPKPRRAPTAKAS